MKNVAFWGLFISLFTACSNDLDHKIEGKWQLKETIQDGITTPVDTVYYNFQNALFAYQIANGAQGTNVIVYGYKTEQNDGKELLLELNDPTFVSNSTDWLSPQNLFTVEKATKSKLILKSNGKIYQFKKF